MKRSRIVPLAITILGVFLSIVVYFAAYSALGTPANSGNIRIFSKPWQANLFTPAAKIESLIVGHKVSLIVVDAENPFL